MAGDGKGDGIVTEDGKDFVFAVDRKRNQPMGPTLQEIAPQVRDIAPQVRDIAPQVHETVFQEEPVPAKRAKSAERNVPETETARSLLKLDASRMAQGVLLAEILARPISMRRGGRRF